MSDDDEPAIVQRDLRGDLQAWIEVGSPSPERLHKATKLAPRVAVYGWKNVEQLAAAIAERGVHRADELVAPRAAARAARWRRSRRSTG